DRGHIQRGGAGQPAVSEDPEDGVPGADEAGDRGPAGAGPDARESGSGPGRHDRGPAQGQSGMISSPGFFATVSEFPSESRGPGKVPGTVETLQTRATQFNTDDFQPGSTWEGSWTFEDPGFAGQMHPYRLTITERL